MTRKFVSVRFDSTPYKEYHFLTDIEDLKLDEQVVVDTQLGLSIAVVKGYIDKPFTDKAITKWVVQRVDMDAHKERLAREKKLNKIKEQMDARRKELQDIQLYQLLAKDDDAMKDLLDNYLELLQS